MSSSFRFMSSATISKKVWSLLHRQRMYECLFSSRHAFRYCLSRLKTLFIYSISSTSKSFPNRPSKESTKYSSNFFQTTLYKKKSAKFATTSKKAINVFSPRHTFVTAIETHAFLSYSTDFIALMSFKKAKVTLKYSPLYEKFAKITIQHGLLRSSLASFNRWRNIFFSDSSSLTRRGYRK